MLIAPTISLSRQRLVADDLDAGDRQATSLVDAEDERRAFVARWTTRVDRDPCEVVALALVQRVDAGDVLRDLRRVDRLADQEIDAIANGIQRDLVRTDDLERRSEPAARARGRRGRVLPPTISQVVDVTMSNWFVA